MRLGKWVGLTGLVALAISGCGGDGEGGSTTGPTSTDVRLHGIVSGTDANTSEAISGAAVRVTIDRNKNGVIDAGETISSTANKDGVYDLRVKAAIGDMVVVRFSAPRYAPVFRSIQAAPRADALMNVVMRKSEALEYENGLFISESRRLSIQGLPEGLTGSTRVFNPVTETDSFPGNFGDDQGNLLISGVFAVISLEDEAGDEVSRLGAPARLRMALPRDTWNVVVDITPDNGQIDVPLYAFDEVKGTWTRDGEAQLEDAQGRVLDESELASVRDGSFEGTIFSSGDVNHFSYWNVDWPVESHACLTGRIVLPNGTPDEGATVTLRGETYSGFATPFTVGPDGRFCIDAMRSERPGEDVDQDGVLGETQRVGLRVLHQGSVYNLGGFDSPVDSGTCGQGGCAELGDIVLEESLLVQVSKCTFQGRALDQHGVPVSGAMVMAYDESVMSSDDNADRYLELCGDGECFGFATTDTDGAFTLTVVMFDQLNVIAYLSSDDAERLTMIYGLRSLGECPSSVEVRMDSGYINYKVALSVTGNVLSWSPNKPIKYVTVYGSDYDLKWYVAFQEPRVGPLTCGVAPPGTDFCVPDDCVGPPLSSGDHIQISADLSVEDGLTVVVQGLYTVP